MKKLTPTSLINLSQGCFCFHGAFGLFHSVSYPFDTQRLDQRISIHMANANAGTSATDGIVGHMSVQTHAQTHAKWVISWCLSVNFNYCDGWWTCCLSGIKWLRLQSLKWFKSYYNASANSMLRKHVKKNTNTIIKCRL